MQVKKTDQIKKPEIPIKEKTDYSVWQKPKYPNTKFIKQIRLPGSQHRG